MRRIIFLLLFHVAFCLTIHAQWNIQPSGISGSILQSVFFTTATKGYAVGNGGVILKTTNGGLNWVAETSPTSNWLFSICFPNAATGYIVGENGTILKSTSTVNIEENNFHPLINIYPNPFFNANNIASK